MQLFLALLLSSIVNVVSADEDPSTPIGQFWLL